MGSIDETRSPIHRISDPNASVQTLSASSFIIDASQSDPIAGWVELQQTRRILGIHLGEESRQRRKHKTFDGSLERPCTVTRIVPYISQQIDYSAIDVDL
jgi:hypothetical protein